MKAEPDTAELVVQLECAAKVHNQEDIHLHLSQRDCALAAAEIVRLQSAVDHERNVIAEQARVWAGHYPQGSDGRNTFVLLAEWIEARGHQQRPSGKSDAG